MVDGACELYINFFPSVFLNTGVRIHENFKSVILLTETTAAQNEVALSYHRVRGLYFPAVVSAETTVILRKNKSSKWGIRYKIDANVLPLLLWRFFEQDQTQLYYIIEQQAALTRNTICTP